MNKFISGMGPVGVSTSATAVVSDSNDAKKNNINKPCSTLDIKNAKAKVNSLPAQRKNLHQVSTSSTSSVLSNQKTLRNRNSTVTVSATSSSTAAANIPSRQAIIKRQKSDLTGLKVATLHKEYLRNEKLIQQKELIVRPHFNLKQSSVLKNNFTNDGGVNNPVVMSGMLMMKSSLEDVGGSGDHINITSSAETIIEMSTFSGKEGHGDNCVIDKMDTSKILPAIKDSIKSNKVSGKEENMIDMKIQTNQVRNHQFEEYTDCSIEKTVNQNEMGDQLNTNHTGIEETDECDEHQRRLVEEQESLERQIRELESTEIDVDTETDETDCEVGLLEGFNMDLRVITERLGTSSVVFLPINEDDIENVDISLEKRYHALLAEMSRGEREQVLATLQAYVSRHPGRAQELHQKLSSPSRRRSLQETLKKYQAKQTRAQEKRELLQKERAIKIQQLLARVEEVKAAKRQLIEDKRLKMEGRLQRAAENREQYLRHIIEKAHDEEKKLKEINFIKNIEAQNKRLDLIESSKETEVRLQDLEQERQKRLEEKAAKEAAVERRRQQLEKERQQKMEKLYESRLEKEQRIGKMQELKERQRQALAREKARDREERLLALQVQQQQTTEELQRKILQKQQESARRHEENIEHIRQRALELTLPSRSLDENGQASSMDMAICNNGSENENSDMAGKTKPHVNGNGREHCSRAFKKKLKKLRQRLVQRYCIMLIDNVLN